MAKMQL